MTEILTPEIVIVLAVLAVTVILFVTEAFRIDVTAMIIMLSLGLLGIVTPADTFSGFASNAVLTIIAIMILGHGIERTGIMFALAHKIVETGGVGEKKIIAIISSVVGFLSAFMQNIGSVALFLPAVLRISSKTRISVSRLIMPMGFAAILGGTLTMVGSSPLILLNDFLIQGDLEPFGIFDVTPVGLALLLTGILYFLILGHFVLPEVQAGKSTYGGQNELIETWDLPGSMHHYFVPDNSRIIGLKREDLHLLSKYSLNLLAVSTGRDILYAPWRYTVFSGGDILTFLGFEEESDRFASDYGLFKAEDQKGLTEKIGDINAGFAEIMIRPRSSVAGKTIREIAFRKTYGLEIIVILSQTEERRKKFSNTYLKTGDTIVVYGPWDKIEAIGHDHDFVSSVQPENKSVRKDKGLIAVSCFLGALMLSFTGLSLSLSLFTGAVAMLLAGVVTPDEAYRAVDWKIVFLLAGMIPLGIAMDKTGTAAYIAENLMVLIGDSPVIVLLFAIGILATFFSLFMTNVAATVLLVPLVIIIGNSTGVDPRGLALLVAVCVSNSFILPTHQVNAFLMNPGGYHNSDYLRAGGIMTVLFLAVAVSMVYILFV
ncbi:SLC13 family permease [Methanoplanus endosymbiosus]|uniref:SLC13 family permease n=1 Tax=Methanoplanus endosymbiosus TaxID=33865 RepID=A0A9E7TKW3_9EURY|nr:SLC13 family permease [Methanoplanus endosymbiosus]UUX93060.1 SLC13 family permease [Methanoplanus endosymbiosus]